jgi:hypothetical protein
VVLLEMPQNRWGGHTILTADRERAKSWAGTRWKALSPVPVHPAEEAWNRFSVFSSAPDEAAKVAGDRVLKEMAEAADVFKSSSLSVALFGNKYVCIAIPNTANLFEPSNIHVPVSTRQHAQQCRKEVGQLLEVIDIFSALGDAAGPDIP